MVVKQYIVIDKSYLEGATSAEVRQLCAGGALMTDTLFVELLTTSRESRKRCFAKFPPVPNPIEIIPSVGDLLRYEASCRRPCTPLHERRLQARVKFNLGIAAGIYQFTEAETELIRSVESEVHERVAQFAQAAAVVPSWFPELEGFPANGPTAVIAATMTSIATDTNRIRSIYSAIAGSVVLPPNSAPAPGAEEVDEGWLWFRVVQVDLLAAVEFVRKRGARCIAEPCEELEHDVMDCDYVAAATVSGALASRDKTMQTFFHLLRPDGLLIS